MKRPLEIGEDGMPVIKKRKRSKKKNKISAVIMRPPPKQDDWEGFDSEDEEQEHGSESEREMEEEAAAAAMDDETSSDGSDAEESNEEDESEEGSEEESDEEEDDDDDDEPKKIAPRQSAFKAWAVQQINESVGYKPAEFTPLPPPSTTAKKTSKPVRNTVDLNDPLPAELQIPKTNIDRKAYAVPVTRPEHIQEARLGLPVVGEEQKIMESIYNNNVTVIWGATGSGKTTQLPQFLFEAGFGSPESPNPGMVAVTQPRRVAAVSMAKRVATELGDYGDRVAYQIRFDSTVSDKTAIKFMTDGVLIREIAQDFALLKYSVIIIDEAHERSVNTDILIGMVSRIIDLRQEMAKEDPKVKPLKLVIMSATLRISDFMSNPNLFRNGAPPLVQAEGRQYPVTVHFARRTRRDYVEEAFKKVTRGHKKLPPGGFLIFLTGQGEIKQLVKRLKQTFRSTQGADQSQAKVQITAAEAPMEAEDFDLGDVDAEANKNDDFDEDEDELRIKGVDNEDEESESENEFDPEEGVVSSNTPVHVLPLYSQLPTKEQLRVFDPVPGNARLIVVATNVAETSLTIPGIRYVFDCGRSKEKQYDTATGIQRFQVGWISKASASQRAGRAGRTGPGHCYRLYSSAVYEGSFEEYTDPEILRTPVEGVVLQMKSMGLHHVINFPFPTPPSKLSLIKAQNLLKNLGAIDADEKVTETGRHLSLYPLSPRFGKMLQIGHQHGCFPYVIAMVAALSVGDLFIPENQLDLKSISDEKAESKEVYTNADKLADVEREKRKKAYAKARRVLSKYDDKAEALRSMAAVCAYAYGAADPEAFCNQMFLRPNAMKEAAQLRRQLYDLVRTNNPSSGLPPFNPKVAEPSDKQVKALKQIVAAGFIDQVAIRADLSPYPPEMQRKPKRAIDVPYFTLFNSRQDGRAGNTLVEKAVFIHPSSLLARQSPSELPQYIVYSHLQQAAPSTVSDDDSQTTKVRMFPLTPVSGLQLSALAHGTPLLEYGKPIGKIESVTNTDAKDKAERRECWVVPSLVGDKGAAGWPLPAKRVVQKKDIRHGWVIEKFL